MRRELSDQELDIYSRQIALDDIGYDGQLKIRNAKACIVGMGGLGSSTALKLVGMGIGSLRMVDRDIVSRSDLHRQHLYDAGSLGRPKVEVALQRLSKLNPDVELEPIPDSLNSGNAKELIAGADVILDGLDRPEPRYILNRTSVELHIPYIFAGAIELFGNVTSIIPGQTPCLECFMAGLKDEDMPKCAVVGVHPSVLGIITSIQVLEAVRIVTGREAKLGNKLLYVDLRELDFRIIEMQRTPTCAVCGFSSEVPPLPVVDRFFEETCSRDGKRTFIISPRTRVEIDLERVSAAVAEKGLPVKSSSNYGLTFENPEGVQFSLLKHGSMVAQAPASLEGDLNREVGKIYEWILVEVLGLSKEAVPDISGNQPV